MKCVALILATLVFPLHAAAELKIMTTLSDFADIARQVGGDKVTVRSVMKGPENVHNVLAKPTEMLFLNKADLFVHSGLDAEPWRDNLLKGARNPRIMPGKPGNVDMSVGLDIKEVPVGRVDRAEGDIHLYGNPHYTIHPVNAAKMTATLARAMALADRPNADFYLGNAKRFVNETFATYDELRERFKPYAGLKVVTFHKAWEYFADAFDVRVVATIEPKPAITPSPGEMRNVIETMRKENVRVVIVETYNNYEQAKSVADAAGARVVVLPDHVNGVEEADTYLKLFRYDVGKLMDAAKAAGVQPKGGGGAD
jgi:zinc/manganese transport system substrate-binding protein